MDRSCEMTRTNTAKYIDRVSGVVDAVLKILPGAFRVMALRFDKSPLDSVDKLEEFLRTRASYIAQTSLFGYLKARMGTQFRVLFEDEVFSKAIRSAAAKLFGTCLADLVLHTVRECRGQGTLTRTEATALAARLFNGGLEKGLATFPDKSVQADAEERFRQRLALHDWNVEENISVLFVHSEEDLVRFAPVIDEFKELDREIVMNSIRFRWRDVREQLRKRLRGAEVARDWTGTARE